MSMIRVLNSSAAALSLACSLVVLVFLITANKDEELTLESPSQVPSTAACSWSIYSRCRSCSKLVGLAIDTSDTTCGARCNSAELSATFLPWPNNLTMLLTFPKLVVLRSPQELRRVSVIIHEPVKLQSMVWKVELLDDDEQVAQWIGDDTTPCGGILNVSRFRANPHLDWSSTRHVRTVHLHLRLQSVQSKLAIGAVQLNADTSNVTHKAWGVWLFLQALVMCLGMVWIRSFPVVSDEYLRSGQLQGIRNLLLGMVLVSQVSFCAVWGFFVGHFSDSSRNKGTGLLEILTLGHIVVLDAASVGLLSWWVWHCSRSLHGWCASHGIRSLDHWKQIQRREWARHGITPSIAAAQTVATAAAVLSLSSLNCFVILVGLRQFSGWLVVVVVTLWLATMLPMQGESVPPEDHAPPMLAAATTPGGPPIPPAMGAGVGAGAGSDAPSTAVFIDSDRYNSAACVVKRFILQNYRRHHLSAVVVVDPHKKGDYLKFFDSCPNQYIVTPIACSPTRVIALRSLLGGGGRITDDDHVEERQTATVFTTANVVTKSTKGAEQPWSPPDTWVKASLQVTTSLVSPHPRPSALVPVPRESSEFRSILALCPSVNYRVTHIDRVQNLHLWQHYQSYVQQELRDVPPQSQYLEGLLWHGTKDCSIPSICDNGFLARYAEVYAYGKGNYFALSPHLAMRYASGLRGKRLVLSRVAFNGAVQGHRFLRTKPCATNGFYVHHGSAEGRKRCLGLSHHCDVAVDNLESPTMLVTFSDHQSYPAYIVSFVEESFT